MRLHSILGNFYLQEPGRSLEVKLWWDQSHFGSVLTYLLTYRDEKLQIKQIIPTHKTLNKKRNWINLYPVDNAIRFAITYPLDSDLSVG